MANIQNVRMGVCSISYNGVDVGHTLGGTKVTITRKLTDLKVDKYGDSPVDKVVTEVQMIVDAKVAEPVVALIKNAIPEGDFEQGASGSRLGVPAGEGAALRAGSAQLILHPLSKALTDQSEDVTVYNAVASSSPVINYEVAGQRVFDLQFTGLVNETEGVGRRLGHIGPTNIS
jgi:hypothetical protein